MKTMKRYYFSLILMTAIFAVLITSCEKDETFVGMTVTGTLEFSEQYNDKITKVQVDFREPTYLGEVPIFTQSTLARGTYSNGAFSLELPSKVDDKYLNQMLSHEDLEPYLKVSNKNVKTGMFDFTATDFDEEIAKRIEEKNKEGNGVWASYLYKIFPLVNLKRDDISTTEGLFYYADRNCSITGTLTASDGNQTTTYSMYLKRGWNIVYHTQKYMETPDRLIHIEELSTKPISGMKWYVRGDF